MFQENAVFPFFALGNQAITERHFIPEKLLDYATKKAHSFQLTSAIKKQTATVK